MYINFKYINLALCLSFFSLVANNIANDVIKAEIKETEEVKETKSKRVIEEFNALIKEEHDRVAKKLSQFIKDNIDVLAKYKGKAINFSFVIEEEKNTKNNNCTDCESKEN